MKNRSGIIWSFVFFIVMAGCGGANQHVVDNRVGSAMDTPSIPGAARSGVETEVVSADAMGFTARPVEIEMQEGRPYLPMGAELISKEGPVPLRDVIKVMADHKGYSVSWADDVNPNIQVNCYIKAADNFYDALNNVLRPLDYFYEIDGDTIVIGYKEVRRYHLAMPDFSETFDTSLGGDMLGGSAVDSTGMSASATLSGNVEINFWDDLETALGAVVTCEGCPPPIINRILGLITVTASKRVQEAVNDYLDALIREAYRQVVLEAKILEVSLDENHEKGVDWSTILQGGLGVELGLQPDGTLWTKDGGWNRFLDSMTLPIDTWTPVIHAFEDYGDVRIVANPKVHLLNGHGVILNVTENNDYVSEIEVTESSETNSFTTSVTTDEISQGLSLAVKANIINDEEVMLYVFPTIARLLTPVEDMRFMELDDGAKVNMADTAVRQMSTYAKVQDGEFLVIGGLIDNNTSTNTHKVPVLGDIPFLGKYLFSYESIVKESTELVILIKPRIIKNQMVVTALP